LDTSESRSEKPGKFAVWCWKKMEGISWAERVRSEKVLQRVKEERNPTNNKKKEE
jgi:hypothetical protein